MPEGETKAKRILVHLGGSWRKLESQRAEFERAGIGLFWMHGTLHGHYSNAIYLINDTPDARALLKKVGGSVCRDQGLFAGKTGGAK